MNWFRRISSVISPAARVGWAGFDLVSKLSRSISRTVDRIFSSNEVENWLKGITGTGVTDADKEKLGLETDAQRLLNAEEYDRKIDFYERFESPEAQVRQYKNAGLNPLLLAGGGASVSASGGVGAAGSAGSANAGASPAALGGLLSGLLGFITNQQQIKNQRQAIDNQFDLGNRELAVRASEAEALTRLYNAQSVGKEKENSIFDEVWDLNKRDVESNIDLRTAQKGRILQLLENDKLDYQLKEKGIILSDKQIIAQEYQNAILEAQKKNADKYYSALANLQSSIALLEQDNYSIMHGLLQKRVAAQRAELNDIIIKAGMDAKVFTGEGFAREVEGKMTSKDQWELWTSVGTSILGTAASFAVPYYGAMRGAARAGSAVSTVPSWFERSIMQGNMTDLFNASNRPTYRFK